MSYDIFDAIGDASYAFGGSKRRRGNGGGAFLAILALFALGGGILTYASYSQIETHSGVTICGKDSVQIDNEGGHEYRIYTTDGTYRIVDHVVNGTRFNTADTYGHIAVGAVYDISEYGWRNGPLSMFPNITEATLSANQTPGDCRSGSPR